MDFKFRQITKRDIQWATDMQKERMQLTTRLALNYANDPEKKTRLAKQYCIPCYYRESTVAGAAMTSNHCAVCAKEMFWSSTHNEKLCHDCAKEHGLCKECGATVTLKEPRSMTDEQLVKNGVEKTGN